jgi:hypothetical protein
MAPSDCKNGINLVYYQPQVDSWDNYRLVKARMAFSLTPSGKSQVLGVVSVEAERPWISQAARFICMI